MGFEIFEANVSLKALISVSNILAKITPKTYFCYFNKWTYKSL